jgi:predicted P-loop ATPase
MNQQRMKNELTINGETLDASLEGILAIVRFLNNNYQFRFNQLNGKVEFVNQKSAPTEWRDLTEPAINSIILKARMEQVSKNSPKEVIMEYVNSEDVARYDPINAYLNQLPEWDGQNHVARLFSRIPGITSEQLDFLCVWIRSAVAHWRQMDLLHGNECVPVLVGAQGCGKTTFFTRLLPPTFRQYYMDHLNTANQNDKNMALTNNLLVNIDELDGFTPRQMTTLKQLLSVSMMNYRPIYGKTQQVLHRYASFVATTNNPHPLTDVTGSRRFICMTIPNGQIIDNTGEIDHEQLFAQIIYELDVQKAPYWFNNEQVARIQELNLNYMAKKDMVEIVSSCFRKPKEGEKVKPLGIKDILQVIRREYPTLKDDHGTITYLGRALSMQGFERTEHSHVAHYKVIPLKAA